MNPMIQISNKPTVHLYVRWSTDEQKDGDSNRRQLELGTSWCAARNIKLPEANIIKDEGVSAFRGKNVHEGKLGQYLEAVKIGKIVVGSSLLVENLDRLSRQDALQTMATIIYALLQAGIILVTLDTGKEYKWPLDFGDMVTLAAIANRGNGESERKKTMLANAWKNKRDEARKGGKKLSAICPAWLRLSDDRMSFIEIPERVEIVKRIYRMSIDGLGIHKITQTLNREGVKPFNGGGKARKNPRDTWANSSVNSILSNRAVFGEFQMKIRTHGKGKGKANDGEPIANYYPAIMTEAEWNASSTIRNNRKTQATGRKGETLSNLFTGIAFCSECGGKMHQRRLGTYKSKNPEVTERYRNTKILYCSETLNGNCTSKAWDYSHFENSFLTFMRNEVDVETIINGGTGSRLEAISTELKHMDGERVAIEAKLNKLLELDDDDLPMDAIKAKLAKHKAQLQTINEQTAKLNQERNELIESRNQSSDFKEFEGFPTDLQPHQLYDIRAKVATQISSVIESVHLYRPNIAKRVRNVIDVHNQSGIEPPMADEKDSRFDRRYVIRFQGGATRTVFPDGRDSKGAFVVLNFGFNPDSRANLPNRQSSLPQATVTSEEFKRVREG